MVPLFSHLSVEILGPLSQSRGGSRVCLGVSNMLKLEQKRILLLLTLIASVILGGCSSLALPPQDSDSGINLRYLLGDRRTVGEATGPLVNDSEYAEYLEWKRWQDFQAYQEWKGQRDEQAISGDAVSN